MKRHASTEKRCREVSCVQAGLLWWIGELFRNGSVSFARLDLSPLTSKAPVITCKLKLEALVWSPSYQTSILPHIKNKKIRFPSPNRPTTLLSDLPWGREENHDEKPSIIPALDRRPIHSQLKNDSINSLLLQRADYNWKFASLVLSQNPGDQFLNLRERIRCFNCTPMAWIMLLWESLAETVQIMCWCRCVW